MKKTMIALAVAAALPVAAQADVTLSGTVSTSFENSSTAAKTLDIDSRLGLASTEVLANGMTATATMNMLSAADADGTISLAGDFGTVSAGTAAKTLVDVANSATAINDEDASLNGIAYTGSFAGLSVNASAGDFDEDDTTVTATVTYSTYGASYDFNGLTVSGKSTSENNVATTNMTASYAFGDLTVKASKDSGSDATVTGTYSATLGDLAVTASANNNSEWDLDATYTMGAIALTVEDDEGVGSATVSGTYSADALSVTVDSDSEVTVGYDMGNADLELVRTAGTDASTTVSYVVAF